MERVRPNSPFAYDAFLRTEGLPLVRASVGLEDIMALPREPWSRTGGKGTFIELRSTFESERGLYVAEIPPGGELLPEKHLYQEAIVILQGAGSTEVWQGKGRKLSFDWARGTVFAIPRNASHVLANATSEPVVFLGLTTAPRVMNALGDTMAAFETDYEFEDIYASANYFLSPESRHIEGWYRSSEVHTNLISNIYDFALDDFEQKVGGGQLTTFVMGSGFPHGHLSSWPAGKYHKAHYHGPGAILLGLIGEGYVLAWDSKFGAQPYATGHGEAVEEISWRENSLYSPPNGYFHQHFNTGVGPARHFAIHAERIPLGIHDLQSDDGWRGYKSLKEGGTLIEYEDEDPAIRTAFRKRSGTASAR